MLLNLRKLNGDSELRHIEVGNKLVGLRVYSIVIESAEEMHKILSPEYNEWAKRHLCHIFYPVRKE